MRDQVEGVPALAWRPLVVVAAGLVALLLAAAGRYGFHRDELYFLEAGSDRHQSSPSIEAVTVRRGLCVAHGGRDRR